MPELYDGRTEAIEKHIKAICDILGVRETPSNRDTPKRVAKMYVDEFFRTVDDDTHRIELDNRMTTFPNEGVNTPITVRDIPFHSLCFTSKTPVRMKDGVKYIRDVKVGDTALTFDEQGNLVECPVVAVMQHKTRKTVRVHLSNGKSLRCTPDHPFYVEGCGWVEASSLERGDVLRALNKGKDFGKARTWDFTVNEGYDFGYVLGALASDGCTWRNQTRLEVNNYDFADTLCKCLKSAFNLDASVEFSEYSSGFTPGKRDHRCLVRVVSGYFVDYLTKVFGGSTKCKEFKFPEIVLNSFESFEGFMHGYYMGDGTYNPSSGVRLITANKGFADRISSIFGTYLYVSGDVYTVGIPLHSVGFHKREVFKSRFLDRFESCIKNKIPLHINPLMTNIEVLCVEELPDHEVTVYNFEVEENHTYLAGDVWVHNCEHHWLPFMGKVSVTYVPSEKIIGLSKIPRVVKYFSQRPQLQERLTKNIGEYLVSVLAPRSLVVKIEATHTCVSCRGAESDCETETVFSYTRPLVPVVGSRGVEF